ncbi:MAG TPA: PorV/PorQ family protein, partial [Bacteroidales bacterium]|nr:PorV/PorQ family protein [Bacteroidales bacterium]
MKKFSGIVLIIMIAGMLLMPTFGFSGNEQRAGSSGGSELLINPWARSSAWGDANVACVMGLEGLYQNVAGLAFTRKTELMFNNTQWMVGSGITINSFGLAQKVGESGVIAVGVMNMSFGEIEITTPELPEGGIGTFSPSYSNIQLAYSREFSNSIYGGISVKMINEGIANASASGFAIDAGIQYVTGLGRDKAGNRKRDNLRFGIAMKNVGSTMKFKGDGMAFTGIVPNGTT